MTFLCLIGLGEFNEVFSQDGRVRVGSAAVNLESTEKMDIGGGIESRFTNEQEGELRSVAIVIESPGHGKVAIVSLDVLFLPRDLIDLALAEVEKTTGIPPSHVLTHATHTHHAPSVVDVHGSKSSEEFRQIVVKAIVKSVQDANRNLSEDNCRFFFKLSEENTIGGNSRFLLEDGLISWLNPMKESAGKGVPTGPFDPELPVLDFRDPNGKSRALIFNHSTHTIGTRNGRNVRSASFYGLAAQELEQELGGNVAFLEGASGSTHNITSVPVDEAIRRLKKVVKEARDQAEEHPVKRLAAIRRTFKFKVRQFNDEEEDQKILKYTGAYAKEGSDRIRKVFSESRDTMRPHQGEERETYIQALLIGDVAIVGVPAEYFTVFGVDIKRRSPFKYTYVAELANDWVGYLPDRLGHRLGGYQTWLGLHSYAEIGTGERVADEAVKILNELANPVAAIDQDRSTFAVSFEKKASSESIPSPKSPADEKSSFQLSDPNLQVELVAAEPDVVSPVAMAWDANGRMFVAEMIGYPQTEGLCRIALLDDKDGDGKYTRTSTFADQLNFVNCVMPFRKGILVTAAPDILYLEDTDGDGQADLKRVEWTGFATGSQQLRANALHWGLDNFIYGANGRVGGEIRRPNSPSNTAVSLSTRDFRFDPIGNRFESIVGQSQFGQSHDDWGNRFLSWNTVPIRHVVFDDLEMRGYLPASAAALINMAEPSDTGRIYPISPPPKQFNSEQSIYYNAMCGLSIYRGDLLGEQYAGNAFICESLSNLITRRVLIPDGPTFVSKRAENETSSEFFASSDNWSHPVFTTTGPDGAMYIADFYREFVEHPIYVADVKARAETDWRNGSERGRLWRVKRKDAPVATRDSKPGAQSSRIPRLQNATAEELISQLSHPVSWWRETAQRLLVERQDKSAAALLRKHMRDAASPLARAHCLWTLRGLNVLTVEDLQSSMDDANPQVRRQAVRAAADRISESLELQKRLVRLVEDPDKLVRFQATLALGDVRSELSTAAFEKALEQNQDTWLRMAVLCAASPKPWPLLDFLLAKPDWLSSDADWRITVMQDLAEQLATTSQLDDCLKWLASHAASIQSPGGLAVVSGLARSSEAHGSTLQKSANQANSPWKQLQPSLKQLGVTAGTLALDEKQSVEVRRIAAELLGHLPVSNAAETLLSLLMPVQPQAVQTAAAKAVASLDDPVLYQQIFDTWQTLTTVTRRDLLNDLLRTKASISSLLDAVADDRVPKAEVPSHVRDALWQHRDPAINDRAKKVLVAESAGDRQEVVTRYLAAVPSMGEASRGVVMFRQHCAVCHAMKGVGQRVGPDLAAVGSRRRDFLIVDILDPSRHVTPDFRALIAITRQGRTVVGVMAAETPTSFTLRRERGEQETILRSELEELRPTSKSIMPEGFEKFFSPEQLADLLEYLRKPDGV